MARDLYSSLTRMKMALNDGVLPPMTPIPEGVVGVIDPAFTIGWGALREDPVKGLQCPVRGCGRWFQNLGAHASRSHRSIGGASGLRKVMSIPHTAPLVSQAFSAAHSVSMKARIAAGELRIRGGEHRSVVDRGKPRKRSTLTVGAKNLLDRCEAQLSHKLIDLHNSLRRSPGAAEFAKTYGSGALIETVRVFGSWNAALARCGLEIRQARGELGVELRRHSVIAALAAYHEANKCLPTSSAVTRRTCVPTIPAYKTVLAAFRAESWRDAMERAAAILSIEGGRWGLPFTTNPATTLRNDFRYGDPSAEG